MAGALTSVARHLGGAAIALLAAALPAAALTLDGIAAGDQVLAVDLAGGQVAVDLDLRTLGEARFTLRLDAADLGQWLPLDATVRNSSGAGLGALTLRLDGASFALVGDVAPDFGQVAQIDAGGRTVRIAFDPAETSGLTLGSVFGRPGAADWLLVADDGAAAGSLVTLQISAVPEPAAWWLLAAGLPLLVRRVRRA